MKKLLVISIIIFNVVSIYASEMILKPLYPQAGDIVSVEYSGNSRFSSQSEIILQLYCFDGISSNPKGFDVTLKKGKTSFSGTFELQSDVVYSMMGVTAEGKSIKLIDNNYGKYWEILTYRDSLPVEGAYLKAALARLGSISSNIDRIPDYYEAIDLLEKELDYYPDNLSAGIGLITTLFDMKKINKDEFEKKIKQLSEMKYDENNESDVKSIARVYSVLKENQKADLIISKFVDKNPQSSLAEEVKISEISRAESFGAFNKSCNEYFKNFPLSYNFERVLTAYSTSYLQSNKLNDLIAQLDSMNFVPGYIYARIARNLFDYLTTKGQLNKPVNKQLLLNLVDKAERKLLEQNTLSSKTELYTQVEWNELLDIQQASILEIKANLLKEYEPLNSVELFVKSIDKYNTYASDEIYENLIDVLITLGDSAKAIQISESAIINGNNSQKISEFNKEAMKSIYLMNDSVYLIHLDTLLDLQAQNNFEMFRNEILNSEPIQFLLETLDGTYIETRDLKDKIIVMNFFSSWCSPCQTMFPAFDEIVKYFSNSTDVEVVAVNSLENNKLSSDELKKFILQNDLKFPIVKDAVDIIPRKLGINGLPSLAIIDKQSRLRFIIKGFSTNEDLINDVINRVDFLNNSEVK